MATYNRSNLLPYSIGSLQRSTFRDWELIVVGDACTDDTAEVVAELQDQRIRFVNRDTNCGEQTGPNNLGVTLARGRYVAFLNQDDLWFPDHIERSVAVLEEGEAELVFGQALMVAPAPPHRLIGAVCGQRQPYAPWMLVPASLWVMRRELADRVGPWKLSHGLRGMPSQEWLYAAHRLGVRIVADPALCAVIINAGSRANCYRDRPEEEHRFWFDRLDDAAFLRRALAEIIGLPLQQRAVSLRSNARELLASAVRNVMIASRLWPPNPIYWMKYWRKGSFLRELRRLGGLE